MSLLVHAYNDTCYPMMLAVAIFRLFTLLAVN